MTHRSIVHFAVLLLALGCSRGRAGKPARAPVTIARAEQRAVPYEITATGTVEPRQTVSIQSQVTGVLTDVGFHEGDDVETGQVLFRIDPVRSRGRSPRHRQFSPVTWPRRKTRSSKPTATRSS